MQSTLDPLQSELDQEADATLRVLQRVPLERFERRPHPRSVSLGELALQIARIPAGFSRIVGPNEIDIPTVDSGSVQPAVDTDLASELHRSLEVARGWLEALDGG